MVKSKVGVVEEFLRLAQEPRFKGWPVIEEGTEVHAKVPFFGEVRREVRENPDGSPHDWFPVLRWFGWAVVFGVTRDGMVPTLCQWKDGVNCASWELPPGGVREIKPGMSEDEITGYVQAGYLKETGFGGGHWQPLGHVIIESGKYRGESLDDHGLKARLYLATDLEQVAEARQPAANEIMETIMVPFEQVGEVLASGSFNETSAVACAYRALVALGRTDLL